MKKWTRSGDSCGCLLGDSVGYRGFEAVARDRAEGFEPTALTSEGTRQGRCFTFVFLAEAHNGRACVCFLPCVSIWGQTATTSQGYLAGYVMREVAGTGWCTSLDGNEYRESSASPNGLCSKQSVIKDVYTTDRLPSSVFPLLCLENHKLSFGMIIVKPPPSPPPYPPTPCKSVPTGMWA